MLKIPRDEDLKKARGYKDPKSVVFADGREILKNEDWRKRKRELWHRCGGQCEYRYANGSRCREDCHDPHHIIPRSKGRTDELRNLLGICREHHKLVDPRKPMWTKKEGKP